MIKKYREIADFINKYKILRRKLSNEEVFLTALLAIGLVACLDIDQQVNENLVVESMDTVVVPKSFNYNMVREVAISLQHGTEMAGARFKIYDAYPEEGGNLLSEGIFDANGSYNSVLKVSNSLSTVYVQADFITLESVMLEIVDNKINYNYTDVNIDNSISLTKNNISRSSSTEIVKNGLTYLYDYNNYGIPKIIVNQKRPSLSNSYTEDFKSKLNATFIEGNSIPKNRPGLVSLIRDREITIINDCTLDITFLHKVASYNNSLAYYTYDISNPPKTKSDITNLKIVFPNVTTSSKNKYDYLVTGDKVSLGSFKAGTVVGFALVSNGWNQSKRIVDSGKPIIYSNQALNNGAISSVMLYDNITKSVVFGFEDTVTNSSDNDMNDVIFSVSTPSVDSIKKDNFPELSKNSSDYNGTPIYEYYPSKDKFNTLAYEDLWPQKGDYDFNDQVIGYNYKVTKNTKNEVLQIDATYKVKAVGAGWLSIGFGITLDIDPKLIERVTGYKANANVITRDAKGLEANQNRAVIIVYEDAKKLFGNVPSDQRVNVSKNEQTYDYATVNVVIKFVAGTNYSEIENEAPFNPFIFRTSARGHEIHLPNEYPTDLADNKLFGTMDDRSGIDGYYRTANNLPWAIDVPYDFEYPVEGKAINFVYKRFVDWAKSGGTQYTDWYRTDLNKTGYFDKNLMY